MRKFTACVLSAGILMLTEVGNVDALFGRGKTNSATKADTVSVTIFGTDTKPLITSGKNLQTALVSAQKDLGTAITNMKKQTADVKTYDSNTGTVGLSMFFAGNFEIFKTFFETFSILLNNEVSGLTSINSSKSLGDAKEITGRQQIRLARKILKIIEGYLASVRANIALTGKMCKGEKRISNAGAIISILQKLQISVTSAKRNLVTLTKTYAEERAKIADSAKDKEMSRLFNDSVRYIEAANEIISLYEQLLDQLISYAQGGDYSNFVQFARECEDLLATGEVALRGQVERYEELNNLSQTNRGNVSRRKEELESNSKFKSERGRRAYENSVEREDFESVAPASRQLKRSQSSGSISNYRSNNNNRNYRDSRADDED